MYKDVLFLALDSEDPPGGTAVSAEQRAYVKKTLEDNPAVRWTFVFIHQPIWTVKDQEKCGWAAVEKSLAGRGYTVFCGHVHRYQKFVRNGRNYYQLATTGGSDASIANRQQSRVIHRGVSSGNSYHTPGFNRRTCSRRKLGYDLNS